MYTFFQATLFARIKARIKDCRRASRTSIKALVIRTAVNASPRPTYSNASERTSGRAIRAQHEDAAHMERQLADLHEKEMRIVRCVLIRVLAIARQIARMHTVLCRAVGAAGAA